MRGWRLRVFNPGRSFGGSARPRAAEPLSGQALWHIVKRRAHLAGLDGDYGAHSLRSGFVTEAGRQNVPLGEAMALTGHRSVQTVMRCFQTGVVQHTRAGNLLKDSNTADRVKSNG
jgi:integrase